jgi:uncharacterized membrane protein HdeD (DUF308 family)
MPFNFNYKQKSPKRRFLLILGVVTLVCVCTMGIMVMFWDRLDLGLSQTQRIIFGALFLIYGLIRFSRLFKDNPDDK